jgi:hypothetical protein
VSDFCCNDSLYETFTELQLIRLQSEVPGPCGTVIWNHAPWRDNVCKSSCMGYLTWKCQQEVPASYSGHENWTPSISWVLELPLDEPPLNDGVKGLVLAVQFNEPTGKWLAQHDG